MKYFISLFVFGVANLACAQQNFVPGFSGLKATSQAPPGIYGAVIGYGLNAPTVADRNGDTYTVTNGGLHLYVAALAISGVTNLKLFGANYGYSVAVPFCNYRTEVPNIAGASGSVPWGITSTYIQPINLGWHKERADFSFGYALYLPTGSWTFGGSENHGLGMYTHEFSAGTTLYLDAKKASHFTLQLVYDINSTKKGTTYKQCNPLTFQGGIGLDYGKPEKLFSGWLGVTGFAQLTVQPTESSGTLGTLNGPYPTLFGAGPEFVTMQGALTVRYLFEFGAKSNFQGQVWCATFAYPLWMPKESPK
jgi:hypothetical protein